MAPMLGDWDTPNNEHALQALDPGSSTKSILYVDAYDSFSYNVVAMLEETLGVKVTVMTIDSEWPDSNMSEFLQHYEAIVLGPGPGDPNVPTDVGIMNDIWNLHDSELLPVFGICLGFQSLCLHNGVPIERLPYPIHGQIHKISTSAKNIFEHLPEVEVTLYHSLYANSASSSSSSSTDLEYLAWLSLKDRPKTQIPMAVRHLKKPFWGVQFHPESCKSEINACNALLRNWWRMALGYNKIVGRGGYCSLPSTVISPHTAPSPFPDAAYEMLNWSKSTSKISAFRSLSRPDLTAEAISEIFNKPGSPAVLFQSNGQYNIASVPSPGSWRFEYNVETHKLRLLQLDGDCKEVENYLTVVQLWDALRYLMEMKKVDSGNSQVPFWGGFLGYLSYELGLTCLPHPSHAQASEPPRPSNSGKSSSDSSFADPPDVSLLWCERSIVVDNTTGAIVIQSTRDADAGWLDDTLQQLQDFSGSENDTAVDRNLDSILQESKIQFPEEKEYKRQIESCKAELEAGESYELCLTSETSITLPVPEVESDRVVFPWKLYRRLKRYNPAAFSAFADLGDTKIASSSPECFLNWDRESTLEMKPMKGTVRKSPGMTMEKACEILSSTKEMAENLMIADLIRHDLYGICGSGGVHVEKLLEVADYGRVYSMITHIKGKIRPNHPGFAVRHMPQLNTPNMSVHGLTTLQRCLPPGSMTGAPKERSCMHLRTIENRKRGIYSGVMGFLDLGGGGSFSVLIRSAFTCYSGRDYTENKQQTWRIGAGGAITTLSTAEGEWDEMLTKLRVVCNVFKPLNAGEESVTAS